jgi:hypothetical protein
MTTTKRNAGPLGTAWTDIGSDVNWTDYGGNWARHIEGTRYHVIRFHNCEEWGDGATGYHVDLREVDLTNPQLERAMQGCGPDATNNGDPLDWSDEYGDPLPRLALVAALADSGAPAPLWQDGGTNAHKLLRAARAESRMLARDAAALEERMDRSVNAIGTSARNYGLGKLFASD